MTDSDTAGCWGCLTVFALIVVAPFIIAAVPVLLGVALGVAVFFLIGALISAIFGAIFRR